MENECLSKDYGMKEIHARWVARRLRFIGDTKQNTFWRRLAESMKGFSPNFYVFPQLYAEFRPNRLSSVRVSDGRVSEKQFRSPKKWLQYRLF